MVLYATCGLQKMILRNACQGSRESQCHRLEASEPAGKGVHPGDHKPCQGLVGLGVDNHHVCDGTHSSHGGNPPVGASGAEEQALGAKAV